MPKKARIPKKADAVFEGGGVKGIGLVGAVSVMEKAGYAERVEMILQGFGVILIAFGKGNVAVTADIETGETTTIDGHRFRSG